jgi:hypothetical protein
MRKLAEINPIAAQRVLAYLNFEMEQEEMSQEERDAQFIAVAEALGVKNEDDTLPIVDLSDMGQWLKEVSR